MNLSSQHTLDKYKQIVTNYYENGMNEVQAYCSVFCVQDERLALSGFQAIRENAHVRRFIEEMNYKPR